MTTTTITTEDRIRAAYRLNATQPGQWVSLTDIRVWIQDLPRDEQDRALRALNRRPDVVIIPESNQKILTAADWDAALWLGGQWKHLITIW